ncbi:hypothetical protein BDQ17DRAFT_1249994, partial [Cyathus striatus]
ITAAIIIFEYILTFQYEVERFWKPRVFNWAAILFYINRYLTLFGHIPVMVEYFWTSSSERKFQSYHQYLSILIQVFVACMLIMRTYALFEKSRKVLILYLSVSFTAICIGCWAVGSKNNLKTPPVPEVPVGCGATLRLGAAWSGMLIFDVLVFSMTLYKSLTLPGVRGINLLMILIRDGEVMVVTNLANIVTFMVSHLFTRGVVTTFTNTMSSILISRLMLNLRDPELMPGKGDLPTCTVAPYSANPVLSTVINTYNSTDFMGTSERQSIDRRPSDPDSTSV